MVHQLLMKTSLWVYDCKLQVPQLYIAVKCKLLAVQKLCASCKQYLTIWPLLNATFSLSTLFSFCFRSSTSSLCLSSCDLNSSASLVEVNSYDKLWEVYIQWNLDSITVTLAWDRTSSCTRWLFIYRGDLRIPMSHKIKINFRIVYGQRSSWKITSPIDLCS